MPNSNEAEKGDLASVYLDAQAGPFHALDSYPWKDPDTVSIASNYTEKELFENVLNIGVYSREQGPPLSMRALLDTGAGANMMRKELADRTGFPIQEISGASPHILVSATGEHIHPLGVVELRWYFNEQFTSAKSYNIPFLVCPDSAPYDVVLGFQFLQEARVFKFNESFAMVLVPEDGKLPLFPISTRVTKHSPRTSADARRGVEEEETRRKRPTAGKRCQKAGRGEEDARAGEAESRRPMS